MEKSSRRRTILPLKVLASSILAGSRGGAAFVVNNVLSLSPSLPSTLSSGRVGRSLTNRRRQQDQAQFPFRFCIVGADGNFAGLAGSLSGQNAFADDLDGWCPKEGIETGTVSLVGSGPGDPDLLTVAGLRELKSADLVIADRLVSKEILGLVRMTPAHAGTWALITSYYSYVLLITGRVRCSCMSRNPEPCRT